MYRNTERNIWVSFKLIGLWYACLLWDKKQSKWGTDNHQNFWCLNIGRIEIIVWLLGYGR